VTAAKKNGEAGAQAPAPPPTHLYEPFTGGQLERLGGDLDPSRVFTREGPGGKPLSYVKAHDAIKTANEIFGYGGWGYRVVEQERIGETAVTSKYNKPGWHVAYRCVVELTVAGCVPTSGTGYGDGVEYTPTARATACELALKESESDALKRALRNFGNQFGLSLYMNDEEKQRAARDRGVQEAADYAATNEPVRSVQRQAGDPSRDVRFETWRQVNDAFAERWGVEDWGAWMNEAAERTWGKPIAKLNMGENDERAQAFRKCIGVYLYLRDELMAGVSEVETPDRTTIRAAFAKFFDGVALDGPPEQEPDAEPEQAPAEATA
jgi:DNA recombination protein Rad52